jgi:hypothetical protein
MFNFEYFMSQAAPAGGVDAYVDQVAAAIDAPGEPRFRFRTAEDENMGPIALWLVGVAKDVAVKVILAAGKEAGVAISKNDASGALLQLIDREGSERAKIQESLDAIQGQLGEVSAKMDVLKTQISSSQTAIINQVELSEYRTRSDGLRENVAVITALDEDYRGLVSDVLDSDGEMTAAQKEELVRIKTAIKNDVPRAMDGIHQKLAGAETPDDGLLALWSRIVLRNSVYLDSQNNPSFRDNYSMLENQFAYYGLAQLTGLNLLVEAYNADGLKGRADTAVANYKSRMGTQTDLWLGNVEAYLIEGSNARWAASMDSGWTALVANGNMTTQLVTKRPLGSSEALKGADAIVNTLTGETAPVIRVRIVEIAPDQDTSEMFKVFRAGSGYSLNKVDLQLKGPAGTPINASSKTWVERKLTISLNGQERTFSPKWSRFTFKGLEPGDYTMVMPVGAKSITATTANGRESYDLIHPALVANKMTATATESDNMTFHEYTQFFISPPKP